MATRPYNYKHPFKPAEPTNLSAMTDREVYGYVERQLGKFDYDTDFHYGINLNKRLSANEKFNMLAPGMQKFTAMDECIGSVFGDGLYSYFEYAASDHAALAQEVFRRIGAIEVANTLAGAMAEFGSAYPADGDQRQAMMQPEAEWMRRLEPHNLAFQSQCKAAGDPIELLGSYMKQNAELFFEQLP